MTVYKWKEILPAVPKAIEQFHIDYPRMDPSIRKIFYILVSMELLPNVKKAYKRLDAVLVDERVAKRLPWGLFRLDEERRPVGHDWEYIDPISWAEGCLSDLRSSVRRYSLPFWERQGHMVVVACEKVGDKELLASVLRDYRVRVIPGRGYAAWETWAEEAKNLRERKLPLVIKYVGDFDPSGEDMPKFLSRVVKYFGLELKEPIEKVSITQEQVERFKLPYEPEKADEIEKLKRDPRFRKWPYGLYRVETDAMISLHADDFKELLRSSVERYIDFREVKAWQNEVEEEREKLSPIFDEIIEEGKAVLLRMKKRKNREA